MAKLNLIANKFVRSLTKIKNPDEMLKDAGEGGLEKTLGVWDLMVLGIGAIIGSGIFAVVGLAAAGGTHGVGAGPALVVSMLVAAAACVFAALCYTEFATMIPVAGGAYTYTYATLGELAAWVIGWVLMLEYAVGFIVVSCAWSNQVIQFIRGFEHYLPSFFNNALNYLVIDFHIGSMPLSLNLPAIAIVLWSTALLTKGTKDSTKMAGVMVVVKLAVIALFVLAGAFFVKPANWVPFAPNGFEGVFVGAFMIFFAYIGFDAIASVAEECKNPQKDLPIGIIGSLVVTTVIYVAVALVLTGMVNTSGAVPVEFLKTPMVYVMSLAGQDWAAGLISIGSIAGLTSVIIVMQMAGIRILYAMSRDHFVSKRFQKLHPKFKTPHILTWTVGILSIFGILTLDLSMGTALSNFGTLTAFTIVCVAILILRKTDPDRPRPFKVPFSPLFPSLGILCCGGLMVYTMMQPNKTPAYVFLAWLVLGVFIYFSYGFIKNRKVDVKIRRETIAEKKEQKLLRK